jgi:hypothetical protein
MQSADELNLEIEITKLVGVMAACYPSTQMADASVKAYVSMLKDIPLPVLEVAIEQAANVSEFLPTVAKIRDMALALTRPARVSALEAWGLVKEQMRLRGIYRSPEFSDPLIANAVECIGWRTLCSSENEPADRAHFAKVYDSLVIRDNEDARLLPSTRKFLEARGRHPIAALLEAAGEH